MLMLYLYVLQNQWLVIALLCGAALVLVMALTYQVLWQSRSVVRRGAETRITGPKSFLAWLSSFIPWVIILIFIACAWFTVSEITQSHGIPPNW